MVMTVRASMCDTAQKEFRSQLSEMGLQLREVEGDGNCLFRALGDQMEGNTQNHVYYRQETAQYMKKHRCDFEPFLDDDCTFQQYICRLQKEGTFAGNDAIVAFARRFDVNVVIHQLCAPLWIIEGGCCHAPELHLAYYNGDHYGSIRRIGDCSSAPARIWLRELKKYRNDRRKKKPADCDIRRMIKHIMNVTECLDQDVIENLLEQHNYDVDRVIAEVTGNNPCLEDLDCRNDAEKKNQKFDGQDCVTTIPEDCDMLMEASDYDRGRSPGKRSSRKESIIKSTPRRRSSVSNKSTSRESSRSRLQFDGSASDDRRLSEPTYNQTRKLPDENLTARDSYSDISSAAGHDRYKERGEIASIPPATKTSKRAKSLTPPATNKYSRSSSRSRSRGSSTSNRSVSRERKSSRKSPRTGGSSRGSSASRSGERKRSRKSSKTRDREFSTSPKVKGSKRSPAKSKSRSGEPHKTPITKKFIQSVAPDEELSPKSARPLAKTGQKLESDDGGDSEADDTCEEPDCPMKFTPDTQCTTVKQDASVTECDDPPPCSVPETVEITQKGVLKSGLPIICKTLSDAVMSTTSSSSQDQIDKSNCALRPKKNSDTWLNIILGILVAFLVLCLIRLF